MNLKIAFIFIILFSFISISSAESELQNETSFVGNSSIEQNIVIIVDASGSTGIGEIPFISYIDANALYIVQKIARDSRVGVVAFSGITEQTDMLSMSSEDNKAKLEAFIKKIGPDTKGGDNPTNLDKGLLASEKLLNSVSGTKQIIVISDGMIHPDAKEQTINTAIRLKNEGIGIQLVQVLNSYPKNKEPYGLYAELAQAVGEHVQVLNPDERVVIQKPKPIPTPTVKPISIPRITQTVMPTTIPTPLLEQEVKDLKERLNKVEEKQNQSWLKSTIDSILNWFKTIF